MTEDIELKLYDAQIATVVHGFMQVWNKFEGTLSKELTQIQERLEGMHPGRESHPHANYQEDSSGSSHQYWPRTSRNYR